MADLDQPAAPEACDPSPGPSGSCAGIDGSPGRRPLSCDRIVDAAVRYVDHDRLDGLSMRRLGAELGVEAMSLYRYFPSKAALLDAVVCRLLADIRLPEAPGTADWETPVRAYAASFRAICADHPRLLPLLATMGPGNPTLGHIEQRMTQLWRDAGFDAEIAAQVQAALQGYLIGACLQDTGSHPGDAAFHLGLDALILGLRARSAQGALPV